MNLALAAATLAVHCSGRLGHRTGCNVGYCHGLTLIDVRYLDVILLVARQEIGSGRNCRRSENGDLFAGNIHRSLEIAFAGAEQTHRIARGADAITHRTLCQGIEAVELDNAARLVHQQAVVGIGGHTGGLDCLGTVGCR